MSFHSLCCFCAFTPSFFILSLILIFLYLHLIFCLFVVVVVVVVVVVLVKLIVHQQCDTALSVVLTISKRTGL